MRRILNHIKLAQDSGDESSSGCIINLSQSFLGLIGAKEIVKNTGRCGPNDNDCRLHYKKVREYIEKDCNACEVKYGL